MYSRRSLDLKRLQKGEILLERLKGKKILVDPGHGGSDPGAVGTLKGEQILEKDLTLMFAKSVKSYLELDGATVIMTRTTDTDVTINERWQMGRDNNVDAVISVHFNSGPPNAEGVETYYAKTRESAPYTDKAFAEAIHAGILGRMGMKNRGVKDDTLSGPGSLGILRYPSGETYLYPRCLVEVEFITNPTAMEALDYPLYEASLDFAAGVLDGMRNFFGV